MPKFYQNSYKVLALVIVIFLLACKLSSFIWQELRDNQLKKQISLSGIGDDFENKLILEQKTPLSTVTLYELEQIPGVSSSLAEKIYLEKESILSQAANQALTDQPPLRKIKGIGEKKNNLILKYLELN